MSRLLRYESVSHSIKPSGAASAAANPASHLHNDLLQHCGIDEETIEAYALGRLRDPELKASILMCRKCQARVSEVQNWNAFVRKANRRLLEVDPASAGGKR